MERAKITRSLSLPRNFTEALLHVGTSKKKAFESLTLRHYYHSPLAETLNSFLCKTNYLDLDTQQGGQVIWAKAKGCGAGVRTSAKERNAYANANANAKPCSAKCIHNVMYLPTLLFLNLEL